MIVVNLLESLLVLLVVLVLALLLPYKWFTEKFTTMGSACVILALGGLMLSQEILVDKVYSLRDLLLYGVGVGIIILIISFFLNGIKVIVRILSDLSNRFIIFLYIWGVVSVFAVCVVLIRNIF